MSRVVPSPEFLLTMWSREMSSKGKHAHQERGDGIREGRQVTKKTTDSSPLSPEPHQAKHFS